MTATEGSGDDRVNMARTRRYDRREQRALVERSESTAKRQSVILRNTSSVLAIGACERSSWHVRLVPGLGPVVRPRNVIVWEHFQVHVLVVSAIHANSGRCLVRRDRNTDVRTRQNPFVKCAWEAIIGNRPTPDQRLLLCTRLVEHHRYIDFTLRHISEPFGTLTQLRKCARDLLRIQRQQSGLEDRRALILDNAVQEPQQ